MKVLVHGAGGHMGRIVCELAAGGFAGSELASAVSPEIPAGFEYCYHSELSAATEAADVVVDFSHHSVTAALLSFCCEKKLPLVLCTTGHTEEEKALIYEAAKQIPLFFSANMSIGVAVTADLARRAAAAFPQADIEIIETHHNRKLDVPSGTALLLADAVREARPEAVYNIGRPENGKRTKEEIGIHSIRMGNQVGTHEILICTGNETITIKHEAENRALFAEGALTAAAFLVKQPVGLYNMKDMFH